MRIALWDSHRHHLDEQDVTGGSIEGQSIVGRLYRYACHLVCPLERQPVALELAYLAAIFQRLRHSVEYFEDDCPWGDIVVFRPTLATLDAALNAMKCSRQIAPKARQWIIGPVAARWPSLFTERGATVLKGEAEQLLWCFDQAFNCDKLVINLGCVDDLDALPWPQWSCFEPDRFRLPGRFRGYPVAAVRHSRGVSGLRDKAGVSPQALRYRPAERVVSELRHQIESGGFEAFEFCDPRFGANPEQAWRLIHLLGRLPRRIEFAAHCHPADLTDDLLTAMVEVGLSALSFAIALPSSAPTDVQLEPHMRLTERCGRLNVRTRARLLMHAEQADTALGPRAQYSQALAIAKAIGATLAEFAWSPVDSLPPRPLDRFSLGLFNRYYARPAYAARQWRMILPIGETSASADPSFERPQTDAAHPATPRPLGGLEIIRRTRGLRKDAPHQRAPTRRKHGSSPHE